MGHPVDFVGKNTKFVPGNTAHKERGVTDIPAFNNGVANTTCWDLAPDEIAEIVRTGKVWASQLSGPTEFFPMYVGSERAMRAVLVDFGKTIPRQPVPAGQLKLVIVESPFAGDVDANITYARAAMADSLARGEAPIASHLLYTQPGILDDTNPEERKLGIEAGLTWGRLAQLTAVYVDRGISRGMELGIERARREGRPVETRKILS